MQSTIATINGLKTNPNYINTNPGGLSIAKNINIDRPNVTTSRRGFAKYGSIVPGAVDKNIKSIIDFEDTLLIHYSDKIAYDSGNGEFIEYADTFTDIDTDIGMRHLIANGSLLVTTSDVVKKLDTVSGTWKAAGGIKAITVEAELEYATGGGFMPSDCQVAYRVLWGEKDTQGRLLLGTPSQRAEITNREEWAQNVILRIYIPEGITENYFFQVYRSYASAGADYTANDELYLCYEDNASAEDLARGYLEILDQVDESLLGASLYTNATQEGILQANDPPPLSKDMTYYKNCVIYANTATRHSMYLTIISVGGNDGIAVGDVITIGGIAYTGAVSEDIAFNEFLISDAATVAEKIAYTAKSLVKVINASESNTSHYAYYISGYDDLPGKILIERRDLADETFYATASDHPNAFNPSLPSSGTSVSSSSERLGNRVYVSKQNQPDSVPITNYFDFGDEGSSIVRCIALRDSVFVFKDNGEIHRLVGEDISSFSQSLFDSTCKIYAPKTAVVFNNQIFMFSNQGVVAVSDTGVEVKSWDIENMLLRYLSPVSYPDFKSTAFSLSYESDRKYILSDTFNIYVYNSFTNAWTTWEKRGFSAIVKSDDDTLYIGGNDGYVYKERKNFEKYDYADDSYPVDIISYSDYEIELADITDVEKGMTIRQGARSAYIEEIIPVSGGGGILTVDRLFLWDIGTGVTTEVYTPIECKLKFLPIVGNNPATIKRFREISLNFLSMNDKFNLEFYNNFNVELFDSIEIIPEFIGSGKGTLPFGLGLWGGTKTIAQENRTYIPLSYQRALWQIIALSTEKAFTDFSFLGISLFYDEASERYTKVSI